MTPRRIVPRREVTIIITDVSLSFPPLPNVLGLVVVVVVALVVRVDVMLLVEVVVVVVVVVVIGIVVDVKMSVVVTIEPVKRLPITVPVIVPAFSASRKAFATSPLPRVTIMVMSTIIILPQDSEGVTITVNPTLAKAVVVDSVTLLLISFRSIANRSTLQSSRVPSLT